MEYTHFGYKYLDKVPGNKIHTGIDLNFGKPSEDLGKPVYAIDDGEVVYAKYSSGWGNMIVIYHDGYWTRSAHLKKMLVQVGDIVAEGQQVGECGGTGGNWIPHLHFDVIVKKLPAWTNYTTGWSIDKVKEYYANPLLFFGNMQHSDKIEQAIKLVQKISGRAARKKDSETVKLSKEALQILKDLIN